MTTLQMKQYLMVIVVIVLSVMFPGERSYADSSRMSVNTTFTLDFIEVVCNENAENYVKNFGLITNMNHQESLTYRAEQCLTVVLNGMNPVIN